MRSKEQKLGKSRTGKAGRDGEPEAKGAPGRDGKPELDGEEKKVVPLAPDGIVNHLEGLGGIRRVEGYGADWNWCSAEEPVEDEDAGWKGKLVSLIDFGKVLAWPTRNRDFWREVPGRAELWKMPEGDVWVEQHLKIRTKLGEIKFMELNSAQQSYSRECAEKGSKRNIVLKARQMGITSYIAARFFVQTITRRGALTMLVAHDRMAAEEIFRIVQPGRMRLAEDRLTVLERNDIRRNLLDRIVTACIAFAVSAAIALHDHFFSR
jgi:hypothetical protein